MKKVFDIKKKSWWTLREVHWYCLLTTKKILSHFTVPFAKNIRAKWYVTDVGSKKSGKVEILLVFLGILTEKNVIEQILNGDTTELNGVVQQRICSTKKFEWRYNRVEWRVQQKIFSGGKASTALHV